MSEKGPFEDAFEKVLQEKLPCRRTVLAYFDNFEDCTIYLIQNGPDLWLWSILKDRDIVDMGTCETKEMCQFQAAKILGIGEVPMLKWETLEEENDLRTKVKAEHERLEKFEDKPDKLVQMTLFVEKKDDSHLPWEIKVFRGTELWAEGWAANFNAACLDAEHMVGVQ